MGDNKLKIVITEAQAGMRLDQALAESLQGRSRSQIQAWIRAGAVTVNGVAPRQKDRVAGGETVEVAVPEAADPGWVPERIALDVVFEDQALLVIDKPAGLVTHPGAGNPRGTLLNALLHHAPQLQGLARAGIVHRLDKDTSGLLVVAKTEAARLSLIEQLQSRTLGREYYAFVNGVIIAGGEVDAPIGRHARDRTRMAVQSRGKTALTHYRVEEKYRAHTLLRVRLASGRTHQIRVHMAYIHHPIIGDPVYAGRRRRPPGCSDELDRALRGLQRQALHAARLGLEHPVSGEAMSWESPLPEDLQYLREVLRRDRDAATR